MLDFYIDIHGEIVITLFRILIGIMLLISDKVIPRKMKQFIVTTYYGVLFGVLSIYISNLRVYSILIGKNLAFFSPLQDSLKHNWLANYISIGLTINNSNKNY